MAHQEQHWVEFYEAAWAARSSYLNQLIQAGETDPLRLVGSLNARERKYRLLYEQATGQATFEKHQFEEASLSPAGVPITRLSSHRGQFVDVPFYAETPLWQYVLDFQDEHGPFDALVELGSGYGRNLFEIYYNGGPKIPYYGGELSVSGVRLARTISTLESQQRFSFFSFDHLNPNLQALPRFRRVLFFTMHTLEQVNQIAVDWFRVVSSSADEVICLHFEPFGFQVQELGEATKYHRRGFEKFGWNANFYDTLKAAEQQSFINIDYIALEPFLAQDKFNPPSLAIWRNRR